MLNFEGLMRYLPVMVFLTAMSCSDQTELSVTEKDRVAEEVRAMLHQYDDDVRTNGLLAEFAYLDSSEDFFWVPPGYNSPLSYDSVLVIITKNAALLRSVDIVWDSLRIIPHSGSLATFTGNITSRSEDTSGNVTTVRLIETGLAVKRHDGWKLLSGQTSLLH